MKVSKRIITTIRPVPVLNSLAAHGRQRVRQKLNIKSRYKFDDFRFR